MIIKKLQFHRFIKEAKETKKETISRFYLHSENVKSRSPPPPPVLWRAPWGVCYRVFTGSHFMPASVSVCVCLLVCVIRATAALEAQNNFTKADEENATKRGEDTDVQQSVYSS